MPEEEETKRLETEESQSQQKKADDDDDDDEDDWFLYEGDSDTNPEEDDVVEAGQDVDSTIVDEEEGDGETSCLEVHVCSKNRHKPKFTGLIFFELFKVRLIYNDKLSDNEPFINARLYGEIVTITPGYNPDNDDPDDLENQCPVSYYCNESGLLLNLDSDTNKSILLPISGPNPSPPTHEKCGQHLSFGLKIDGQYICTDTRFLKNGRLIGNVNRASELLLPAYYVVRGRDRRPLHHGVVKKVFGHPELNRILICAHYSLFVGSWAKVEVTMLKDLGVSSFYGVIVARPCIFRSRIRLLTISQHDDKAGEAVESDVNIIKLTRSVVAVPSNSSLVVGAVLYDHRVESPICRGKTAFAAKIFGEETNYISYNGVETLKVKVTWNCLP